MDFLKTLRAICPLTHLELNKYLYNTLTKDYGYKVERHIDGMNSYLFCKGTLPIMCVAHLDTVHSHPVSVIRKRNNGEIYSPEGIGGDDRCGVAMILALLDAGYRPTILFPSGEEIGGLGTHTFCNSHKRVNGINWLLEIDRRGVDDVVCYQDSNPELTKAFETFGFRRAHGSYTDISTLMPHLGLSGVNVSSAYYNAHTLRETIHVPSLNVIFKRLCSILDSDLVNKKIRFKGYRSSYPDYHSRYLDWYSPRCEHQTKASVVSSQTSVKFGTCCHCQCTGKLDNEELLDTDFGALCSECAESYINLGLAVKCPSCNKIIVADVSESSGLNCCSFCGQYFC